MKKITFGKIKLIIIGGVAAYTIISLTGQHSILAKQKARKAELEEKREQITREIDFKKNELEFIGTDEYIEREARRRLGWLYPDEVKFIESEDAETNDIVFPTEPAPSETPSPSESLESSESASPESSAEPSPEPSEEPSPRPLSEPEPTEEVSQPE